MSEYGALMRLYLMWKTIFSLQSGTTVAHRVHNPEVPGLPLQGTGESWPHYLKTT